MNLKDAQLFFGARKSWRCCRWRHGGPVKGYSLGLGQIWRSECIQASTYREFTIVWSVNLEENFLRKFIKTGKTKFFDTKISEYQSRNYQRHFRRKTVFFPKCCRSNVFIYFRAGSGPFRSQHNKSFLLRCTPKCFRLSMSFWECLWQCVFGTNGIINSEGDVREGTEIETRSSLHHHLPGITAIELGSRRKQESLLNDDVHRGVLPFFETREKFSVWWSLMKIYWNLKGEKPRSYAS